MENQPETESDMFRGPETENRGWEIILEPEPVGIQPKTVLLSSLIKNEFESLVSNLLEKIHIPFPLCELPQGCWWNFYGWRSSLVFEGNLVRP